MKKKQKIYINLTEDGNFFPVEMGSFLAKKNMIQDLAKQWMVGLTFWSLFVGGVFLLVQFLESIFMILGGLLIFLVSSFIFVVTGKAILKVMENDASKKNTKNKR